MSFEVDLAVPELTEEQGRLASDRCSTLSAWPVRFGWVTVTSRWGLRRERVRRLTLSDELDGRCLLTEGAEWDAEAWSMDPELLPRLAETVRLLSQVLPQGFAFRATWTGSEIRHEIVLTADELADLVATSRLNEFTRYRVPSR